MLQVQGLRLFDKITVKNGDLVEDTKTFALGGGEWSIEAYLQDGSIKEFVGNNGTRGYEADDLWAEYRQWCQKKAYSCKRYVAPDGTVGSYSFFKHELERGRLHGVTYQF